MKGEHTTTITLSDAQTAVTGSTVTYNKTIIIIYFIAYHTNVLSLQC